MVAVLWALLPALVRHGPRPTPSHRAQPVVARVGAGGKPLNILVVEAYDKVGINNLYAVGCRKASETFVDMLLTLSPAKYSCSVTVIEPCSDGFSMPTVDTIGQYDGVVWTGSSLTIHDDAPDVKRQIELARLCFAAAVPQYGSCWGLQLSAAAAGLPCEENPKGREHGIGRDITLTSEGLVHPMFDGTQRTFDGLVAHTDQVASSWALADPPRCPPGVSACVLARNEWSPVQALSVRMGGGVFWAVQYHPELEVRDVARLMLTPATRKRLVDQGSFASDEELVRYSKDLEQAQLDPNDTELRRRLRLDDDILDPARRSRELANWLQHLVVPTMARDLNHMRGPRSSPVSPKLVGAAGAAFVRRSEPATASVAMSPPLATQALDNPYSGDVSASVTLLTPDEAMAQVRASAATQRIWAAETSIEERSALVARFIDALEADADRVAADISKMMGKTLKMARGEVFGVRERAEAMMALAPTALAPDRLEAKDNFERRIEKVPVGVVLCIAPWNYPLLTAINCIASAVLAGNSVQIKHSSRTPLCADAFERAFAAAGAPLGLVQALHVSGPALDEVIALPEVGFVSFTGSVGVGRKVYSNVARQRFIDVTLELGGKDAAYVAADADVQAAAAGLVDGAFYNAGQSCCAIERVYVHEDVHEEFMAAALEEVRAYRLGDPMDEATTMGPLALPSAPSFLQAQVDDAISKGARLLCGGTPTMDAAGKGRFFAPTLLDGCDHTMEIMREESFGPVLGVQKVASDAEAAALMNDSDFGLTAVLFTSDVDRAERMASIVEAGTIFMNRCDYLDPLLVWTGVKDSGKGYSLSKYAFRSVTRLKSIHFKLDPNA